MFKISRTDVKDVVVFDLVGIVTHGEAATAFRDSIAQAITEGNKKFVLVYGQVTYVDSTYLGELVKCYTAIRNSGGEVVFAGARDKVLQTFQITKLDRVFKLVNTVPEALAHYGVQGSEKGLGSHA